jgi:hypothetical protein
MRFHLAIAALLVGLVAVTGPAQAKEASSITLTGSHTAYVDVEFDHTLKLELGRSRMDYNGDYAGWMMHRVGGSLGGDAAKVLGGYVIRDAVAPGQSAARPNSTIGFGTVAVKAGTYRIYLVADGPTEVRIPIASGSPSLSLAPTTETTSAADVVDFTVGQGGVINEEKRTPVHVGPTSFGVSLAAIYSSAGTTAHSIDTCFAAPGAECEPPVPTSGAIVGDSEGSSASYASHYAPGELAAGDYEAVQTIKTAGSTAGAVGAFLIVDLVES